MMYSAVIKAVSAGAVIMAVGACSWRSPDSVGKYSEDLDACRAQMAGSHAEMSAHDRDKSCKQQVGPAPMVVPARAPVAL